MAEKKRSVVPELLKRFTVSVESNRLSICRFEKTMSGNNIASAASLKRIVAAATSYFFNPMHPYHGFK
jgi:hypothetical protein